MTYIAVIGSGTMAAGIAAGFIAEQYPVLVLGRNQEKVAQCLQKAVALAQTISTQAAIREQSPSALLAQQRGGDLDTWTDWQDCIWVIETVAEDLALKQAIFQSLDQRVPPHIPIGSNSSGFPISKIAQNLLTANRMIGAHYFMPAEIVPLVEIVLGEKSALAIAEQVCSLYRQIHKKPVLVKRDIPGFLANRIQHALMREALALVDAGIATPADIDDAVRYSFGFRYAAIGPMTQKEIYPSLANSQTIPPSLVQLMAEGKTGMKAGAGYRSWTPEEIKATTALYSKRLKAAFDVLNME